MNRNKLCNGDIVGMTNDNPMILNQSFKPTSKRILRQEDVLAKRASVPQSPRSSIKITNQQVQFNNNLL